jgi:hypothetical protein
MIKELELFVALLRDRQIDPGLFIGQELSPVKPKEALLASNCTNNRRQPPP